MTVRSCERHGRFIMEIEGPVCPHCIANREGVNFPPNKSFLDSLSDVDLAMYLRGNKTLTPLEEYLLKRLGQ